MDGSSALEALFPHQRKKRSPFGHCGWRDWSSLPRHLLFDIVDRFTYIDDYIRFGRVCISWRSIFLQNMKHIGSPLLLIAPPDKTDFYNQRVLYSLPMKKLCNFRIQLPHNKFCRGASFGWLITMELKDENRFDVQLQNLFRNCIIRLPPLDNIVQLQADKYDYAVGFEYLWKAVLSSDPLLSDNFIVMGIMGRFRALAFFKSGNKVWTSIGEHRISYRKENEYFRDVIFFRKSRQFCALHGNGAIFAIEFQGDDREPQLRQFAPPLGSRLKFCEDAHLIEDFSLGDLLLVGKWLDYTKKDQNGKSRMIVRFVVFRFDQMKQNWTEIHNLGNKVLFIGSTYSVLHAVSDCPGCVPGCIYYSTDPHYARFSSKKYYKPISDGIYNLEDGGIQPFCFSTIPYTRLPTPVWLEPTS